VHHALCLRLQQYLLVLESLEAGLVTLDELLALCTGGRDQRYVERSPLVPIVLVPIVLVSR
jgi:hypothetical protein